MLHVFWWGTTPITINMQVTSSWSLVLLYASHYKVHTIVIYPPFGVIVNLSHDWCYCWFFLLIGHGEVLPLPIALCMWWSSFMIGKKRKIIVYAWKKKLGNFSIICNFFVNAYILNRFARSVLVFWFIKHTFGFFFHLRATFLYGIENGSIFWKWKYDKWKYMWNVYECCNGRIWNKVARTYKVKKNNENKH